MSPLVLLGLLASAQASERVDWRLWSWTGVEARPSYAAVTQLRVEQQLGVALRLRHGWSLDAVGSVHDPVVGTVTGDLYRFTLGWAGARAHARLGRLVLAGERGFLRLDGGVVDLGLTDALSLRAWGGRTWHPETWEQDASTLAGAELRLDAGGVASGGGGWEARAGEEQQVHRVHAFGRLRSPDGRWLAALAEAAPMEDAELGGIPPARATFSGSSPLGDEAYLGAGLRWEGLAPAVAPVAVDSPMDWLAGPGYLAADLDARVGLAPWTLLLEASPTARVEQGPGISGRAGAELALTQELSTALVAVGATASPSWLLGGVLETRWHPWEPSALRADLGWFRFAPLAGPHANVWEGRLAAETTLLARSSGQLVLAGELAGGADRLLQPWLRGGVSLRGTMGRGVSR